MLRFHLVPVIQLPNTFDVQQLRILDNNNLLGAWERFSAKQKEDLRGAIEEVLTERSLARKYQESPESVPKIFIDRLSPRFFDWKTEDLVRNLEETHWFYVPLTWYQFTSQRFRNPVELTQLTDLELLERTIEEDPRVIQRQEELQKELEEKFDQDSEIKALREELQKDPTNRDLRRQIRNNPKVRAYKKAVREDLDLEKLREQVKQEIQNREQQRKILDLLQDPQIRDRFAEDSEVENLRDFLLKQDLPDESSFKEPVVNLDLSETFNIFRRPIFLGLIDFKIAKTSSQPFKTVLQDLGKWMDYLGSDLTSKEKVMEKIQESIRLQPNPETGMYEPPISLWTFYTQDQNPKKYTEGKFKAIQNTDDRAQKIDASLSSEDSSDSESEDFEIVLQSLDTFINQPKTKNTFDIGENWNFTGFLDAKRNILTFQGNVPPVPEKVRAYLVRVDDLYQTNTMIPPLKREHTNIFSEEDLEKAIAEISKFKIKTQKQNPNRQNQRQNQNRQNQRQKPKPQNKRKKPQKKKGK